MNPYEVLEIGRDASDGEIKKSYKKLALEWHPDKNPHRREEAEKKFKEISEAYQILTDPEKKRNFDTYGNVDGPENPFMNREGGGGFHGGNFMNPNDIFRMFFGGGGGDGPMQFPFGGGMPMRSQQQQQNRKAPSKIDHLEFPLATLYHGAKKKITTSISLKCNACEGKGGEDVQNCTGCNGTGVSVQQRMIGPGMIQRIQTQCHTCQGKCKIVKHICKVCNGEKVVNGYKSYVIDIPPGIQDNEKIVWQGVGNEMDGMETGDVIFVIREKKDPKFHRDGKDLHYSVEILFGDSLLGYTVEIEHISGEKIRYFESGMIEPNSIRKIRNKGMPIVQHPNQFGDLYVHYKINYGGIQKIKEEDREVIRRIFPCLQSREENEIATEDAILQNSEIIKKI